MEQIDSIWPSLFRKSPKDLWQFTTRNPCWLLGAQNIITGFWPQLCGARYQVLLGQQFPWHSYLIEGNIQRIHLYYIIIWRAIVTKFSLNWGTTTGMRDLRILTRKKMFHINLVINNSVVEPIIEWHFLFTQFEDMSWGELNQLFPQVPQSPTSSIPRCPHCCPRDRLCE